MGFDFCFSAGYPSVIEGDNFDMCMYVFIHGIFYGMELFMRQFIVYLIEMVIFPFLFSVV